MDIFNAINAISRKHNGSFFKISYTSVIPVLKEWKGHSVTKETVATVRKGINYSHLKTVKERLTLSSGTVGSLPWGKWEEGYEGLIINNIKDGVSKKYVRLYPSPNKSNVKYFLDGREVRKNELMGIISNSYFSDKKLPDCFTVAIENITKIW